MPLAFDEYKQKTICFFFIHLINLKVRRMVYVVVIK